MTARRRSNDRRAFLLLTLPAIAWFSVFTIAPLVTMFYLSFIKWNGFLDPMTWIGLDNYEAMLANPHFANAIRNTAIHAIVVIPCVMIPAFVLGYFLSLRRPGHRVFRLLFFAPAMLSIAVIAMVFQGFLSSNGAINAILRGLGLEGWVHSWLVEPGTALASIILIDIWSGIGFYAVLFYAALSGVPPELYEAARIDGAGHGVMLRKIAYPSAKRFVQLGVMLLFLYVLLGSAPNVLLLTQGGPGDLSVTLGFYLYQQAFMLQKFGYSQGVGVFVFFVGILGLAILSRLGVDRDTGAGVRSR